MWDQARTILVRRLAAAETITVAARTPRLDGTWSAEATFRAGRSGTVDTAGDPPLSGSYRGVSPMGLVWSERRTGAATAPANGTAVTTVTVTAGGTRLASARLTQELAGPGVTERRESVAAAGFVGRSFTPPGHGRRPAVVVWGGSEGGLGVSANWAALLGSHGIPAVGIAYFDEPGLPCRLEDIPLEYFARAVRWLRRQPDVDPRRVWLLSGSRGSEAELLVADHWPALTHGLIATAPSSIGYSALPGGCEADGGAAAWTWRGVPVPHTSAIFGGTLSENPDGTVSDVSAFTVGLGLPATNAARIPLGRIRVPVLLISGGDDQLWPSDTFARQIMGGLAADPAVHRHLNFPHAGHIVLGVPYAPTMTVERAPHALLALGGTQASDEAAHERDWPAMLRFIASR